MPAASAGQSNAPPETSLVRKLVGFGLTLGASVGTFGFFAVQGIILARMLGPEGRGEFAAAAMFPQVLLYLGLLGAPELMAGYAAEQRPNARLRRTAARYGMVAGLITMATCIALDWLTLPSEMRHVLPLAILCACTMPLQQIRLSVQAVDHGQRQFTRYNQVRLAAAAMFPGLLLLACLVMALTGTASGLFSSGPAASGPELASQASDHNGRLLMACVLFFVAQVLSLLLVRFGMDESWFGPSEVPIPQALREGRGLMRAWLSTELLERLDLVLFMLMFPTLLGLYAAAVPIASLMIIVPNAAGLYGFNRGARENEHLSYADAWRFIGLGLVVQIVCALLLAVVLPWLLPVIYRADFTPAVRYAWLLLPAGIFRGLLQAADSYLRARKKPETGVRARAIGVVILLVISFLGAGWLGDAAIPVGLSVAQAVCFILVAWAVLQDTRETQTQAAQPA